MNFLPWMTVHDFICFMNGVVGCKINCKFMLAIKNPDPIPQKLKAPNIKIRMECESCP